MTAVRVETSDGVCRATLDRPERLNALGEEIRAELQSLLRTLAEDAETRVLVLQGGGRSFSAGADLRDAPPLPKSWTARRLAAGRWQRLLDDLESIPQVTVAKLHGHTVGGAVLLAVSCDFRIADEDLELFIPELALGIPLTWAGLPRLVREIGLPRTRDLVMTGRKLNGREALDWGLVQRLVAADGLEAATDELVSELLRMPPGPLATTRAALSAMGKSGLPGAWADPDILAWALRDPEARDASEKYRESLRKKDS